MFDKIESDFRHLVPFQYLMSLLGLCVEFDKTPDGLLRASVIIILLLSMTMRRYFSVFVRVCMAERESDSTFQIHVQILYLEWKASILDAHIRNNRLEI